MATLPISWFGLVSTALLFYLPGILILYYIFWIGYTLTIHPLARVPGPKWAAISRTWYMYHAYAGNLESLERSLHAKYGPLLRIAPDEVSSADAASLPLIYRTQKPLSKTEMYHVYANTEITTQHDMFTCIDEEEHARYRKIVGQVYGLSNVLKSEAGVDDCTEMFLQKLGILAARREEVDLGQWLQMYAYDVIGVVFLGMRFGFLETSSDYGGFIAAGDMFMYLLTIVAVAPPYARPLIFGAALVLPSMRRYLKAVLALQHAAIEGVAQLKKDTDAGDTREVNVVQQLLGIVREKGEKVNFTDKEVTMEAWTGIVAGADSTAIALRASLYYLIQHPTAMAKALAEIDSTPLSTPSAYYDSIKLPYVQACIKEATRLFPSAAISLQRYAPAEGIELSGHYIPRRIRVGINPAVVQYDKAVFGEDADEFRPERWLESEEGRKRMEKGLLQFGSGTRTCTGRHIAQMQLYKLVPEILRHFEIEMAHDRGWRTLWTFFNKQKDFVVKLKRRKGNN